VTKTEKKLRDANRRLYRRRKDFKILFAKYNSALETIRDLEKQLDATMRRERLTIQVNHQNAGNTQATEVYNLRLSRTVNALEEENRRLRLDLPVHPEPMKIPLSPLVGPHEYDDDTDKPVPVLGIPRRIDVRLPIEDQFKLLDGKHPLNPQITDEPTDR
jgi:hypothetical protein